MIVKRKYGILSVIIVACLFLCGGFIYFPKLQNQVYSLNSQEQSALNYLINFETIVYKDGLFDEKKCDEITNKIVSFRLYWSLLTGEKNLIELDLESSQVEILNKKYFEIDNLYLNLQNYLDRIINESKNFYELAMLFNFNELNVEDNLVEQQLNAFKQTNIKFWENEIYLTYAQNAKDESAINKSAYTYISEARTNIDNCINKIIALKNREQKLAYFKEEINKLPAIVDIKKEHEEALNKLKKELDEYYLNFAIHLSEQDKKTIESYQWQVNKSLERINKSDSNWAIFWIVLIIAGVAGIIMLLKYFVFPIIKKKKGRKI